MILFIFTILMYLRSGPDNCNLYPKENLIQLRSFKKGTEQEKKAKQKALVDSYECIPCQHGEKMYLKDD